MPEPDLSAAGRSGTERSGTGCSSTGAVLGFDTSAAHCAAAVVLGGRVLACRVEPMARGQAERLFPLLAEVLDEAGMDWAALSAIGVGIGPGNFTGIRISVAAARGLSLSLGVPAMGVTMTEAAALDVPRPCRAVVPLRGDDLLWQDFGGGPDPAADADDAARPALARTETLPPGRAALVPLWPLPAAIALIAAARHAAGIAAVRPAPMYLRPADAAPPRDPAPKILP